MRVLLTGGGTAGHVNPALAIAQVIREGDPDAVIEFVGTDAGKENELVPKEGYRLHHLKALGFINPLNPKAIIHDCKAAYYAMFEPHSKRTKKLLRDFRPDIVIGTGGYACWPLMRAAADMGIPTVLHESNAKPGLAVRQLQKHVDRILVNFESTREQLGNEKKVIRVGNPLRQGFGGMTRERARELLGIPRECFFLLSFGGSMGAEEVNFAAIETMKRLSSVTKNFYHLHGTGSRDYEGARKQFEAHGLDASPNCKLVEYIYDMPLQMTAADLIVSRAGAMTISELSLLGKACILIPSPYVAANHQYLNAKTLADADAARLVQEVKNQTETQKERMCRALCSCVEELYRDACARERMQQNIKAFADPDANRLIREEIFRLCGHGEKKGIPAGK